MTDTNMITDPLLGFSPADIVVGAGGQTLADAAAAERPHTITVPTTIDDRPAHSSVTEMIAAVCRAAVQLAPHPFVVQLDEGEWIVAVTDPDDPEACIYTDEKSRSAAAVRMVISLLPTWARQSTHEAQQRVLGVAYAQSYSPAADQSASARRVTLPDGETWERAWQSRSADIVADSADSAARLLWQHLGCPRSAGLMIVPSSGEALGYDVDDWTIAPSRPCWEPVHAFPALTRADADRELPDGTDEVVREIHRARTTDARHASRCRAARLSMSQYVLDECWGARDGGGSGGDHDTTDDLLAWVQHGGDDPQSLVHWHVGIPCARGVSQPYAGDDGMRILAALAAMELHGVGGPGALDGGATATMSWRAGAPAHGRRGLGKGRRQASDGHAWDAAIRDAAPGCVDATAADVLLALPFVRPHDLEWPMALALSRAYETRDDAETSRAWCDVARAVMARAQEPGAPLDGPAVRLGQRYGVAP